MSILSGSLSRLRFVKFPKPHPFSTNPQNLRRNRPAFTSHAAARPLRSLFTPASVIPSNKITSLPTVGRSTVVRASTMSSNGTEEIRFPLPPSCALVISKGDITQWSVDGSSDAIVNPANERMLGGGGADGAIHRAAGPELRSACYNVPEVRPGVRCPTGEARITPGFRLPASHVIHTVGPIYDVDSNPEASLRNAYRNSLRVAKENNIKYVAFPAISCGVYRYPFDEAAAVAISTVREFSNDFEEVELNFERDFIRDRVIMVHFVLFSDDIYHAWLDKANELLQDR